MTRFVRLGLLLFFLIPICDARFIEKALSVTVIEESVNGIRFAHRSDIIDGKVQDIWAINGRSVSYDEYLDAIVNAEREERRAQRKIEDARRRQEADFKVLAQNNAIKKLIRIKISEIVHELTRVKEPLLQAFLKFDEATFATEDDLAYVSNLIQEAQIKCQEEQPYSIFRDCLAGLEGLPEKVHKLYQDSVNYAIKTCDDTRYLKDLLSLIS